MDAYCTTDSSADLCAIIGPVSDADEESQTHSETVSTPHADPSDSQPYRKPDSGPDCFADDSTLDTTDTGKTDRAA